MCSLLCDPFNMLVAYRGMRAPGPVLLTHRLSKPSCLVMIRDRRLTWAQPARA